MCEDCKDCRIVKDALSEIKHLKSRINHMRRQAARDDAALHITLINQTRGATAQEISSILKAKAQHNFIDEGDIDEVCSSMQTSVASNRRKLAGSGYIVPLPIPEGCGQCIFSGLKYAHPYWSVEFPNRKGYTCQAAINTPHEGQVIDVDYHDTTTKPEWCPLIDLH